MLTQNSGCDYFCEGEEGCEAMGEQLIMEMLYFLTWMFMLFFVKLYLHIL